MGSCSASRDTAQHPQARGDASPQPMGRRRSGLGDSKERGRGMQGEGTDPDRRLHAEQGEIFLLGSISRGGGFGDAARLLRQNHGVLPSAGRGRGRAGFLLPRLPMPARVIYDPQVFKLNMNYGRPGASGVLLRAQAPLAAGAGTGEPGAGGVKAAWRGEATSILQNTIDQEINRSLCLFQFTSEK